MQDLLVKLLTGWYLLGQFAPGIVMAIVFWGIIGILLGIFCAIFYPLYWRGLRRNSPWALEERERQKAVNDKRESRIKWEQENRAATGNFLADDWRKDGSSK